MPRRRPGPGSRWLRPAGCVLSAASCRLRPGGRTRHTGTGRPASMPGRPDNAEVYRIAETRASKMTPEPPQRGNTPRYPTAAATPAPVMTHMPGRPIPHAATR